MSKWIAEFELEDGDTMPEHMDLDYKGAKIDFHCKPLKQEPCEDCISRQAVMDALCDGCELFHRNGEQVCLSKCEEYHFLATLPPVTPRYTDAEIQKMQELERAEIKKAYELGKADILEKIRAEIETEYGQCDICEYFENYDYEENDISEYRPMGNIADILQIIDKYKAESEKKCE